MSSPLHLSLDGDSGLRSRTTSMSNGPRKLDKVHDEAHQVLAPETFDSLSDDCSSSCRSAIPPDGGWGWMVVLASFMCNFIVDGIIFSFGIIIREMSKEFGESKGMTAWIGSLQAGGYLVVGPLVSGLANKYGCRRVTIIGSFISSIGFMLSVWSKSVLWMALTFGVVGGIGFGFIYLPAIVTVGYYFEKRRAFATGIAVCGSGIGAFVMAPTVQLLNETYGWRGCIMILSGLILNCAVFGSLFRPIPLAPPTIAQSESEKPLIRAKKQHFTVDIEKVSSQEKDMQPPSYADVMSSNRRRAATTKDFTSEPCEPLALVKPRSMTASTKKLTQSLRSFLDTGLVMYSALEKEAQVERADPCVTSRIRSSSDPKLSERASFWDTFDSTLLTSPSFILLACSGFLTLAGFFIPFMYIVDKAVLAGIAPEKAALLLSIIGITNTIGRVFCGWISDRPQVNALLINNIALVVGGGVTMLSPLFFNTFTSLAVYSSIFGFSIACFVALRSVITVELLGLDRLTSAFGLLLLPQGIATIIGAPFAGWLFDISGSYDGSFYVSGSVILISGLMCCPLYAISRWEKQRQQKG
ncbi:Monocarboxylate transporter 14 [Halotydeus destructor]|nr:Monocarboxylate transporter 14 [Halotydeus destructor]